MRCFADGLQLTAMSHNEARYPKFENGYAFMKDLIDDLANAFSNQGFKKGNAFLRIKSCNPKDLMIQRVPIEENIGKK